MARFPALRLASLGVLFAIAVPVDRAAAQTQDSSTPSTVHGGTGPALGAIDVDLQKQLQSHVPRGTMPRSPTPPDGPDQDPDGGRNGAQCETAVAVDLVDEKHAVGVAVDLESGSAVTRWYTTFDGGATWSTGKFKNEPGYSFNGDATVVMTPNGVPVVVLMQYFGAGGSAVYSYSSLDGGLTWQAGVLIDLDPSNDKVQAAVDRSNGPHAGQVAAVWDRFFTAQGDTIYCAVSDDEGQSWNHVQRVDDVNGLQGIAPDASYGPNSELWVMWADRGAKDIYVDKSTDGGATFGADILVGDFLQVPSPIPGSYFRVFDVFSIAVDWTPGPYSGSVYVLFHRWKSSAPKHADIYCARSRNGGTTWIKSNVNKGDTTSADQVMPFAEVDEHGNLNVAFLDRRLDPSNYLLWTWVARSSDGGVTFAEFPATDVGWDHGASDSSWYLGDYLGLDASAHTVRPFSCDARTGTVDVITDELHLDLHTSASELSAATGGTIDFTLNIGPNHAGEGYWLLGSLTTTPGLVFGNVTLPLGFDAFFLLTLQLTNSTVLQNSLGLLDPTGSATSTLDSLGPFSASLVGLDLYFAALISGPQPTYATNATRITLIP